ncbi:MAG: oligosaccharide flippase family protein [Sulfuricaulis sp.]|uniref:oligosaccharide flippase family protein n=1 Tax=Sulfuricaulis sp. TaxID=2003553 RepID=UPI0025F0CBF3|nr:oligosaccharide flippase family protein [Sulfuricaulis sp.]MCR4347319.1 oligosaccharide flippase family protein [Sulfuricaulis sp.]
MRILQSQFVHHVATLLSGKVLAQVVSISMVPIVARLFDPDDFGVVAIFMAVAQGLAVVAPLRYFRASLLMGNDQRANMMLSMSAWLLVFFCVLVFGVVAVVAPGGFSAGFLEPLGVWIWLLPVQVFLLALSQIMTTAHTRNKTFRPVATADVGEALLMSGGRILTGLGGSSVWGLLVGQFIGNAGRVLLMARENVSVAKLFRLRMSWQEAKSLAIEYRDFPLHDTPAGMVTFMAEKVPLLAMGIMFAPATVGLFAMADRLIRMPVLSAGISIREVFHRRIVGGDMGRELRKPLTALTLWMLLLGAVPFGVLGIFGTELLSFVLGEKWIDAGVFVQILAPWYYASWVNTGVHPVLMTIRRQGLWLRIQFGTLLGRVIIFGIGYLTAADVVTTLKWYSGISVLGALAVLARVYHLLGTQHRTTPRPGGGADGVA